MQVTYGLLEPFHHGRGYQKPIDPVNPAAATTYTHTVPGSAWERLILCSFQLTTDSNSANRIVTVQYATGDGTVYAADGSGVLVTANTSAQQFYGSNQRGTSEWQTPGPVFFPLWGGFLAPGSKIIVNVANMQADDQLSAIHLLMEKFETDESGYLTGGIDSATFADWHATHTP